MGTAQFEALKKVFIAGENANSINGDYKRDTKKGRFVPSNLDGIKYGLEQLIAKGILHPSVWFSDAGAGDYRVVAIASAVYGIHSIGVEYDQRLVEVGQRYIQQLMDLSILNGTPLIIAQGDFTKDKTYRRSGVKFEDIGVFFNFWNNEEKIAKKIAKQSPPGTWFVLETIWGIWPHEFKGLDYVDTIGGNYEKGLWRDLQLFRKP